MAVARLVRKRGRTTCLRTILRPASRKVCLVSFRGRLCALPHIFPFSDPTPIRPSAISFGKLCALPRLFYFPIQHSPAQPPSPFPPHFPSHSPRHSPRTPSSAHAPHFSPSPIRHRHARRPPVHSCRRPSFQAQRRRASFARSTLLDPSAHASMPLPAREGMSVENNCESWAQRRRVIWRGAYVGCAPHQARVGSCLCRQGKKMPAAGSLGARSRGSLITGGEARSLFFSTARRNALCVFIEALLGVLGAVCRARSSDISREGAFRGGGRQWLGAFLPFGPRSAARAIDDIMLSM